MKETRRNGRTHGLYIIVPAVMATLCLAAFSCVAYAAVADAEVSDIGGSQDPYRNEDADKQVLSDRYAFDFGEYREFRSSSHELRPYLVGGQDHDHSLFGTLDPHSDGKGPMF